MTSIVSNHARRRHRFNGKLANTLYSAVLMLMLYDWPHQVYRKIGPPMQQVTERERFIAEQVDSYSKSLRARIKPIFVMGPVPASAGAFSRNAVIVISRDMLDPRRFTDNDIRFILAHEVGHIVRLDAYRFWTRWTTAGAEAREIAADKLGVELVGCDAMRETVAHHWAEFMKGYEDDKDHHPHPETRLREACGASANQAVNGRNERETWIVK
jgi:Zn-dependent protease with chaperone function